MRHAKAGRRSTVLQVVLSLVLVFVWERAAAGELELRFLDVGQASAVLIRNDGKVALVDTGATDDIVARLRALGVSRLDLLVITHNHSDHLGGADAVLAGLPVGNFLDNGIPAKTRLQEAVLRLVAARGVRSLQASARRISLGDAALRVIPPAPPASDAGQNNASLGLVVEKSRFRALLPGDAEVEELDAWLARGWIEPVNVLEASHHGSRNGLTPAWIARTRPDLVVVSVGAGNEYGHPHAAALRYYRAGNRRVLRTDEVGDVIVRVHDDGSYAVETGRRPASESGAAGSGKASPSGPAPAPGCCRVCHRGKACGDGCIPAGRACSKPPGCACDG